MVATKRSFGSGLAQLVVYTLNATTGLPLATSGTDAYPGYYALGVQTEEMTDGDARTITHVGDNKVIQVQSRATLDPTTGVITISGQDDALDEILNGVISEATGDARNIGRDIRKSCLNQVGVMVYTDALDEAGTVVWSADAFMKATMTRRASGRNDDPDATAYTLVPSKSDAQLWGTPFTVVANGETRIAWIDLKTPVPPTITSWLAGAAQSVFPFDTGHKPPAATDVWVVTLDGVDLTITTEYTVDTDEITLITPTTGAEQLRAFHGDTYTCGA